VLLQTRLRPPFILYLFCTFGSLGAHSTAFHLKVYSADDIRCWCATDTKPYQRSLLFSFFISRVKFGALSVTWEECPLLDSLSSMGAFSCLSEGTGTLRPALALLATTKNSIPTLLIYDIYLLKVVCRVCPYCIQDLNTLRKCQCYPYFAKHLFLFCFFSLV